MSINLSTPEARQLLPRMVVLGVGGAGGNAVNNMIEADLPGVDFMVANTDAQALSLSCAKIQIRLGANLTQGLGAGARPEVGRQAAEESLEELIEQLDGAHMCFITAGMGGGTGTGAAPTIAAAARQAGILTVGVVTKPFQFEGKRRMAIAEEGIQQLQQNVDTLIVIPNQNLFRVANEKTTFADAFKIADEVLHSGVRSITDLMVEPGLINQDFADVRTVMNEMGKAMMGTGEAEGEGRATQAAADAIANPLLDDVCLKSARGVLINVTGGDDLGLHDVDEATNLIREQVDEDAHIIIGAIKDPSLNGKMRVSVVATGIEYVEGQVAAPLHGATGHLPGAPAISPAINSAVSPTVTPAINTDPAPVAAINPPERVAPAMSAEPVSADPVTPITPAVAPVVAPVVTPVAPVADSVADSGAHAAVSEAPEAPVADSAPSARAEAAAYVARAEAPAVQAVEAPAPEPQAVIDDVATEAPTGAAEEVDEEEKSYNFPTFPTNRHGPPAAPPVIGGVSFSDSTHTDKPVETTGRSEAAPKKSRSSIFGILTGRSERQSPDQRQEPRGPSLAAQKQNGAAPETGAKAGGATPRLDFGEQENPVGGQAPEDDLDIPAFLRRQAN